MNFISAVALITLCVITSPYLACLLPCQSACFIEKLLIINICMKNILQQELQHTYLSSSMLLICFNTNSIASASIMPLETNKALAGTTMKNSRVSSKVFALYCLMKSLSMYSYVTQRIGGTRTSGHAISVQPALDISRLQLSQPI